MLVRKMALSVWIAMFHLMFLNFIQTLGCVFTIHNFYFCNQRIADGSNTEMEGETAFCRPNHKDGFNRRLERNNIVFQAQFTIKKCTSLAELAKSK